MSALCSPDTNNQGDHWDNVCDTSSSMIFPENSSLSFSSISSSLSASLSGWSYPKACSISMTWWRWKNSQHSVVANERTETWLLLNPAMRVPGDSLVPARLPVVQDASLCPCLRQSARVRGRMQGNSPFQHSHPPFPTYAGRHPRPTRTGRACMCARSGRKCPPQSSPDQHTCAVVRRQHRGGLETTLISTCAQQSCTGSAGSAMWRNARDV